MFKRITKIDQIRLQALISTKGADHRHRFQGCILLVIYIIKVTGILNEVFLLLEEELGVVVVFPPKISNQDIFVYLCYLFTNKQKKKRKKKVCLF